MGIELAVGPFQIGVGDNAGPSVAGTADEDDIEVQRLDHAVQVYVDEVEPGCRAPVSEQAGFDVLQLERLLQQRVVVKIDLPDRKIVCGTPIGMEPVQMFTRNHG